MMMVNTVEDISRLILKMSFKNKCGFVAALKAELKTEEAVAAWIGSFASIWKNIDVINTYSVTIHNAGVFKINVIKEIRAITGLGLKEAKECSENLPNKLMENLDFKRAEEIRKKLEEVGAKVTTQKDLVAENFNLEEMSFEEELKLL